MRAACRWGSSLAFSCVALAHAQIEPGCAVMLCGPEIMMVTATRMLTQRGVAESDIHLSMERNMQCATGHCGPCQFGAQFVCKNGPVFAYPEVKHLLGVRGF